jgi:hypothetical protein
MGVIDEWRGGNRQLNNGASSIWPMENLSVGCVFWHPEASKSKAGRHTQGTSAVRWGEAIQTCLASTELGRLWSTTRVWACGLHICGIKDAYFASRIPNGPDYTNITKINKHCRFESRNSTKRPPVVLQPPPSCYTSVNRYKRGTFEFFLPFMG